MWSKTWTEKFYNSMIQVSKTSCQPEIDLPLVGARFTSNSTVNKQIPSLELWAPVRKNQLEGMPVISYS